MKFFILMKRLKTKKIIIMLYKKFETLEVF